jgi:hypothetical protein
MSRSWTRRSATANLNDVIEHDPGVGCLERRHQGPGHVADPHHVGDLVATALALIHGRS